jgi:hypothetical protein
MASSTFMCQDKYFDFEDSKLKNRILNYFLIFSPEIFFFGKKITGYGFQAIESTFFWGVNFHVVVTKYLGFFGFFFLS